MRKARVKKEGEEELRWKKEENGVKWSRGKYEVTKKMRRV